MGYFGDIRLGDTIDIKFCTVTTTGAPTTLAGSPVISAYPANSTTQLTAGITLSVDFDSVTGLNNVRVVASGGNGYATATNYALIITTGTVGGTSVVGYEVGSFSIEARSALMPTTAAVTLDVAAGGEAGIDWGNVANKTTANALTATSIITTQKVDVDTIKTNPVVNGGTITFPTNATVASTTNITAGTITTVTTVTTLTTYTGNTLQTADVAARTPAALVGGRMDSSVGAMAANTLTASALAADAVTEIQTAILSDATPFPGADIDATISSRAAAATALSTAQWTNTRAGYIDNLNGLRIKKNTALAAFAFLMVDSADHITPKTGLTVVVQRSIDGAAFGNATNTPATELANGVYTIDLAAGDLNGNVITLKMTSAGADQRTIVIATEP